MDNNKNNFVLPDNMEDLSTVFNYISILGRHKEYEKSRELLYLIVDFIRGLDADAVAKKPQLSTAYKMIAENHIRTGDVSAAADLYEQGIEFFPDSDELCLCFSECLTRLYRFELSEQLLNRLKENSTSPENLVQDSGLYSYRKKTAQGGLYQCRGNLEEAQDCYNAALESRADWIPAHIGLIETEIMKGNMQTAKQYLSMVMEKLGPDPTLLLSQAHLALISENSKQAEEIAIRLKGKLLGEDRFEYLLFLIDFFNGDAESLARIPYVIRGETMETEAARIWLIHFKGKNHQEDSARIPHDIWGEEYDALNNVWETMKIQTK